MGFLKKITRPISRALDKIVPNEIKPALPFLAAAAPFMAPGIMGIGGNTMLSRALMSGGLNLGAQLAQEGSEGDFNALSLALASGIGALSAPGSGANAANPVNEFGTKGVVGQPSAADYFSGKAAGMEPGFAKSGLGALEKSSNYLTGVGKTLRNNPFSMDGLKASLVPVGQATTDLAIADTRRLNKQQIIDDALGALDEGADIASRALAIRNAMESYGFTEDEILSTIESAGYRAGGRVGLKGGGMDAGQMYITEPGIMGNPAVMEKIENMREFMIANPDIEDITDYSEKYESKDPDFEGIKGAIKSIDIEEEKEQLDDMGDLMAGMGNTMSLFETPYGFDRSGFEDMLIQFEDSGAKGKGIKLRDFAIEFLNMVKKDKPQTTMKAKDGGRINLREGGVLAQILPQATSITSLAGFQPFTGQPGFAPTLRQAGAVFPRLNELEQGVNRAENKLSSIRDRLGNEQRTGLLMAGGQLPLGQLRPINMNSFLQTDQAQQLARSTLQGMKDGGLMNLGGKEMDLRKGGFVPIGKKERADDVPARLSKNEFVMTADAVRAAGGGSVNEGAKRMYDVMNKLEARA